MDKLNTNNIKLMTSQKIAYDNYQRKEHMKNKNVKRISYVLGAFVLLIGGTITVDAMTDNSITDAIKTNLIKVFVDDKEIVSECKKQKDGSLYCTYVDEKNPDNEVNYTVYDGSKDARIDIDTEEE